jgi:hypothetical protein
MTSSQSTEWHGRNHGKDQLRQTIWALLTEQRAVQRDPVGHIPPFVDAAAAAAN